MIFSQLKKLGPGLLFAGAAIGVSHLVQSTKAGADYGLGLVWALLLVNIFKYPFFKYGTLYAIATKENLLDGYNKLGKPFLVIYFTVNLMTMFTIQAAVTIVTAGLASSLFGINLNIQTWTLIILLTSGSILTIGKFKLLDNMMKCIIIVLTLSTVSAVILSGLSPHTSLSLKPVIPNNTIGIAFLIAFFGWMPAPLDISVWQSIWTNEKRKSLHSSDTKSSIMDFKIGYFFTVILGLCFMALGAFVAYDSSNNLNGSALEFSNKLINLYAQSLGDWSYYLIAIAAFTTMFSTTLTTLDASPRVMSHCLDLFGKKNFLSKYKTWLIFLIVGTLIIFYGFLSEMGSLIKIATIFSFLTAPLYAILNYLLISSRHTPKKFHPKKRDHILSISGIIFLIGFSIWYILSL